jgi:hypothetical protein
LNDSPDWRVSLVTEEAVAYDPGALFEADWRRGGDGVFGSRRCRPWVQPFRLAIDLDPMDRPPAHKLPAEVAMTHCPRLEQEPPASPVAFGALGSTGEVVM